MGYRVDALAARAGVSVDTVRFYQSKGLLPQPAREGRVALYSEQHLERLRKIKDLKDKGFTLDSIRTLLDGDIGEADQALVAAVLGPSDPGAVSLTLDELAERTGVTPSLLEAIEREGLLVPTMVDGERRYTADDVKIVGAGLELLGTGLPLSELLALARQHDDSMRAVAAQAVDLFLRFVRDPIRARAGTEEDAAGQLVDAFRKMLPSTTALVSHHFQRVLLSEARARIEAEGNDSERRAVEAEADRLS